MKKLVFLIICALASSYASAFDSYIEKMTDMEQSISAETEEKQIATPNANNSTTYSVSDGICPIIGYRKVGSAWVARYDPNDPDCPPS